MQPTLLIALGLASLLAVGVAVIAGLLNSAREGFEDEAGFHRFR